MRFRLRYRHIFLMTAALTVAVIFGILHFLESKKARAIASVQEQVQVRPVSPVEEPAICKNLYKIVCHGQSQDQAHRDPTGMVRPDVEGERIVASIYSDIIEKHPDWSPEQADEELARNIFTPQRRGRIEAAFRWVQGRILLFIENQPEHVFNALEKKQLKQRISNTNLEIPPPASLYADEPDLLTKNDVFYERISDGKMRMRVGGAYLFTAKSWFNMVFTMAHELGHSIDPCEVRTARLSFPAYDRLEACFLKTGLVAMTRDRDECIENDQLSETFADWIGAQIAAEALKSFSAEFHGTQLINAATNTVRDLCDQDDAGELDIINHPSPEVRIAKIFGNQPDIRSVLGCSASNPTAYEYCGFDSDVSLLTQPPQKKVSK